MSKSPATSPRRKTSSSNRAPISCACGSARRTMPTICASVRKSSRPRSNLPQAAQHRALDARLAGAFPRGRPRQARQDAGAGAADAAPAERARRVGAQAYADFDYKRIFAALSSFMTSDLSAFYFDIRKDTLYCDPISSVKRLSATQTAGPVTSTNVPLPVFLNKRFCPTQVTSRSGKPSLS